MGYAPISINHADLTIMGVPFPDVKTFESTAAAIGTNMFEGFEPSKKGIEIIRDYCLGRITFMQMTAATKDKVYEE